MIPLQVAESSTPTLLDSNRPEDVERTSNPQVLGSTPSGGTTPDLRWNPEVRMSSKQEWDKNGAAGLDLLPRGPHDLL